MSAVKFYARFGDRFAGGIVVSRIGKLPVTIPDGVQFELNGQTVRVKGPKGELRVDPHPAWDYTFTRIAFNTYTGGTRRVFVADLSRVLRPMQSEK